MSITSQVKDCYIRINRYNKVINYYRVLYIIDHDYDNDPVLNEACIVKNNHLCHIYINKEVELILKENLDERVEDDKRLFETDIYLNDKLIYNYRNKK